MIEQLREFFRSLSEPTRTLAADDDVRVAAAALLFHVSEADGAVSPIEREKIRAIVAAEYGLDLREAERVAEAGALADAEAVDLFRFTQVLMHNLEAAQRIRFVELLWEMVFVDGEVHELEDNVVWRVAELLGVSGRERMRMKQVALASREGELDG